MNFTIQIGEKREQLSSIRTYFFAVSPTGIESPLYKCPALKQIRLSKREQLGYRLLTVEYQAQSNTEIKMVTSKTVLGKARKSYTLFIVLDDKKPKFKITGVDGFGSFEGYGDITDGIIVDGHVTTMPVADNLLKEELGLEYLAAPGNPKPTQRKLIL